MEPSIPGKNCLETGSMTDEIAAIDLENLRELIVPQDDYRRLAESLSFRQVYTFSASNLFASLSRFILNSFSEKCLRMATEILAFNAADTWSRTLIDLFGDHQSEISKTFLST